MTSKTAAATDSTDSKTDLPDGWEVVESDLTGHGKLSATYRQTDAIGHQAAAVISVRPFKSYDQPGFTNCHKIMLQDYTASDPPEKTVHGESPSDAEHPSDARELAKELMETVTVDGESPVDRQQVTVADLREGDTFFLNHWQGLFTVTAVFPEDQRIEAKGDSDSTYEVEVVDGETVWSVGGGPSRRVDYLARKQP